MMHLKEQNNLRLRMAGRYVNNLLCHSVLFVLCSENNQLNSASKQVSKEQWAHIRIQMLLSILIIANNPFPRLLAIFPTLNAPDAIVQLSRCFCVALGTLSMDLKKTMIIGRRADINLLID